MNLNHLHKPFEALNQRIKNELIQSLHTAPTQHILPVQTASSAASCCKTSASITIQQKIGFQEQGIPFYTLTHEVAALQVQQMLELLSTHKIQLFFNGSEGDPKDLYRFITSVFMKIQLPPHPPEMQFCFMYDRLQEEHISDAETLVARVFEPILQDGQFNSFRHLNARVRLNEYDNLSEPELHYVVDRYKKKYGMIMNRNIHIASKHVLHNRLQMKGMHQTVFCNEIQCDIVHGEWKIELIPIDGTWRVVNIQIEGVAF